MSAAIVDRDAMQGAADQACRLLRVLSHPDRLLLLCQLLQGEQNVGELEESLGIGQPTLSQQLGVLREQGLVMTRRDGRHIRYRLHSPEAEAVIETLSQLYCPPRGDAA